MRLRFFLFILYFYEGYFKFYFFILFCTMLCFCCGCLEFKFGAFPCKVALYKSEIFSNLKGKGLRILEIGIGTGPNLSYYGTDSDVEVVGIDPNPKMEKYARSSAASVGLPPSNFEFIQAVCIIFSLI
ncbi:hypothetical protein Fmac_003227 [Flemingia macrophylla]|uniref:Methyltransferase domain-containing protein n=1 Tax=Flemingia macrophylla TaxID=520843 RepID=A0ABD1NM71_9FABA